MDIPNGITKINSQDSNINELLGGILQNVEELKNSGLPGSEEAVQEYLDNVSPILEQSQEKLHEEQKEFLEETSKNSSKIFEGFKSSVSSAGSNMFDNTFETMMGPLNLVTKPLEELTGFSLKDSIVSGFSKLKGDDDKPKKVAPRRSALLQEGVEGAAAVYLGNVLTGKGEDGGESEGLGGDILGSALGTGVGSVLGKVGTALAVAGPALAGIAAFTALKWDDITGAFSDFKEGNIGTGIETFLLGRREDVTEEDTGKNMARQGAAWGIGALGIGTTVAAGSAIAGGASLGSSLLTGLISAFPPALAVAAGAALAKGIQTAYQLEWDKNAESAVQDVRSVFADEASTGFDKVKASIIYGGKGYLAQYAGGLREAFGEAGAEIEQAGQEEGLSRLGVLNEKLKVFNNVILEAPRKFLEGSLSTAGDYISGITEGTKVGEIASSVKEKVSDIFDNSAIISGLITPLSRIRESFNEMNLDEDVSPVKRMLNKSWVVLKESLLGPFTGLDSMLEVMGERVAWIKNARGKVIETADEIREKGFKQFSKDAIKDALSTIKDFFKNALSGLGDFFSNIGDRIKQTSAYERGTEIADKAKIFFQNSVASVSNLWDQLSSSDMGISIRETIDGIKAKISEFFQGIKTKISGLFDMEGLNLNIPEKIQEMKDSLKESISEFFSDLRTGLKDIFSLENINLGFGNRGEEAPSDGGEETDRVGFFRKMFAPDETVDDAIIKKDGTIIRTSPDDNLIATKAEPQFIESSVDKEVQQTQTQVIETRPEIDYSMKFNEMISMLGRLITETAKTKVAVSTTNKTRFDFEGARQ